MKTTDNHEIFNPDKSGTKVYSISGLEDLPTIDNLVRKFPQVFSETIDNPDRCYRIKLENTVKPVQPTLQLVPRKVLVPPNEKMKKH